MLIVYLAKRSIYKQSAGVMIEGDWESHVEGWPLADSYRRLLVNIGDIVYCTRYLSK